MPMVVTFLGTASSYPTSSRGVSCTAVTLDSRSSSTLALVDVGEGSQLQLRRSNLKMGKIRYIFITHLHGDHVFGLPGLISSLVNEPVHIFGPLGILELLNTTLILSDTRLDVNLNVHELVPPEPEVLAGAPESPALSSSPLAELHNRIVSTSRITSEFDRNPSWSLVTNEDFVISAGFLLHRIPCFGFVFEERDQPGPLDVNKAKKLGIIPGPDFALLKLGQVVKSPNNVDVRPQDVLGPCKRGRKLVILGDTQNASFMDHLMLDCDLLFHEATMEEELREKAILYGHSTPSMAAQKALDVDAKKLCLFHFSQRYKPVEAEEGITAKVLLDQANQFIEKNCEAEEKRPIVMLAHDFKQIVV